MTPRGWQLSKLGEHVGEIRGGGTPDRENTDYWNGNIPWASVKDLKASVLERTEEFITEQGLHGSASRLVPANTVIIATRMAVGRTVRFTCDTAINQDLKALIPKSSLTPDFLFHWLVAQGPLLASVATGSTVKGIRVETLRDLDLRLPPIPEQKKIAAILGSVDDAIRATQAVIDQTRKVKQGLLQQLLTRGIGHTRFKHTEIGDLPATWAVESTGKLCRSIVPGRDKPKIFNGDIPWITIPDLVGVFAGSSHRGLHVSRDALTKAHGRTAPKDAVIMTCVGKMGIVAIADREIVINQQLHAFVCGSSVLPSFLYVALRGAIKQMEELSAQTTISYLNKSNCEALLVPVPPIQEQKLISDVFMQLEEQLRSEMLIFDQLAKTKSGLMSDLLSGRTRVEIPA